jgi:phosphoribosylanthranilate isomerase
MWPGSPRSVTLQQLRELTADVPPEIQRVAVVVNPSIEDVLRWRDEAGLTTIQLHGGEDVGPYLSLGVDVFKAVSLESDDDVVRAAALPAEVTVLVDAHDPVRLGGTGKRADWARAATLSRLRRVILAGGLRAENVQDAVAQVNPWALDVSSGLESEPGIKDYAKIQSFFAVVRRP